MTVDRYDLSRFVEAQSGALGPPFSDYDRALQELHSGQKQTHWMWYVFPQLRGLGTSEMSVRYGIESLDEARAYLKHPILGQRLQECVAVVLRHMKNPEWTFGPIDADKFRSCLALYQKAAAPGSVYSQAWGAFGGDDLTGELLARQEATAWKAFLERCKAYKFPRSEEVAALIASDETLMGGRTENARPASTLIAGLQQRIDRLALLTCPEAEPYRRELVAMHARVEKRPHDSFHVWSVVAKATDKQVELWLVYEWHPDQGFIYGSKFESPAAATYSRWALDHPPGLHQLNPPWATAAGDPFIAFMWFNESGDGRAWPFWHALGRMSAEDRSRWVAAHPAPPEWRKWMEFSLSVIDRWTQEGRMPSTHAWLGFIEGGNDLYQSHAPDPVPAPAA